MTAMLDNNVLIDALAARKPFEEDAQNILRASVQGKCTCCFSVNSATDIYHVLRKTKGPETAAESVSRLLKLLPAVSVSGNDCIQALGLPIDDFEDALLVVCATKVGADYIVSRDKELLTADSSIQVISPSEFLSKI